MGESITFDATIAKVTTMADQGLRVVFDLSEHAVMAAAELMAMKAAGVALHVSCEELEKPQKANGSNGRPPDSTE